MLWAWCYTGSFFYSKFTVFISYTFEIPIYFLYVKNWKHYWLRQMKQPWELQYNKNKTPFSGSIKHTNDVLTLLGYKPVWCLGVTVLYPAYSE